jgi:hypothetical protein
MVPVGQHMANLRRKGGLGKNPERAAERAKQLAAIDPDWNCPWPLERCVVDRASPELTGGQLLGPPEMAELGSITASTLRAYISRGNSEVPQPQATVNGRDQWARAAADDWVEAGQRSYEGVRATMIAGNRDNLSPGTAEVRDHFADDFRSLLWDRPDVRKRWILRARNEDSVREGADGKVAQAGHGPGCVAGAHAGGVLGVGGVADVVDLVLDAPVAADP